MALEKEQGFLSALLENVEDGIIACDAQGALTVFNHAAREFHGLPEEAIPAEQWAEHYELFLPDGQTPMSKQDVPLTRALNGEHIRNVEMVIAPKSGVTRTVLASGRAIYNSAGEKLGAVVVMRDITELKAAQESLRRESSLMQALMDNIPDAIYFKDRECRFTRVNRHAPYRGDRPPEDVIGKTDFDFFVEEHARAAYEDEQRIIHTGRPIIDKEEKETYPDGSFTWLSTTKVPILDDAGRVTGIVGISRDITERKLAEEARLALVREQAARAEAEAASRLKDNFLATLSHELRTPLTAILGWAKLIAEGSVDDAQQAEAVEVIIRNAEAQARLIDDLLDISRIITGKLRLNKRPVDLAYVVKASVDSIRPAADDKNIGLHTMLDPRAGLVSGDPFRLQQVIWNLLSNAVKFSPRSGLVRLRLESFGAHVEVAVSDTGDGIAPEFLPFVFERFRQADMGTTRRYGGMGLGLSIVRHLVELHGGTVEALSEGKGAGATFKVRLPVAPTGDEKNDAADAADSFAPVPALHPTLEGVKVLAVEDDEDARPLIAEILARRGAEVRVAATVREALELLGNWRPDVLLSDIQMPDEDGYVLIREVRALLADRGGEIPAAALTAYARDEDRSRALLAGYQAHVSKPIDAAELVAAVASLAARKK